MTQKGFSFLECLIAISIISIIAGFSYCGWNHLLAEHRAKLLQNKLIQAVQLAQQWAKTENVPVSICKSKDQLTCEGSWDQGFIIFTDYDQDGTIHDKSQIVFVQRLMLKSEQLHWRSFPIYHDFLHFVPYGIMTSDNGTFWYCASHTKSPSWALILSKSGHIRIQKPDTDGILKDASGKNLACV